MNEEFAKFNDLVAQINLLNASSDPIDVISIFTEIRWTVMNLDNAIMSEIFKRKKAI